ncbi:MAG: hypothetical protein A2958_03010 [Candidatus Levybacteria bacterium RIFCSPLOWO2_01_FULL_38_13]|nr:MAG: hypothetical protein A2629_03425 [Candidatus Levybacteria bacterium RIFCSPHIGHO2_01_FULL_41_15]OGH35294.1 MAG: hypothetical protein A2958_03010 [Candidatus Levybacteria bacterium RIFCSPLOWO2_01_FULL_38_13]
MAAESKPGTAPSEQPQSLTFEERIAQEGRSLIRNVGKARWSQEGKSRIPGLRSTVMVGLDMNNTPAGYYWLVEGEGPNLENRIVYLEYAENERSPSRIVASIRPDLSLRAVLSGSETKPSPRQLNRINLVVKHISAKYNSPD